MRIGKRCAHCGSSAVLGDAYAEWDYDKQEWIVANIMDKGHYCRRCEGECRIEDYDLPDEGCKHGPEEECMFCSVCGRCREDLDSDDVCMDCGGVDENAEEEDEA